MELIVKAGALFCALSFLTLAGLTLIGRTRAPHIRWLLAACVLTAVWALFLLPDVITMVPWYGPSLMLLEVARTLAFVGFVAALAGLSGRGMDNWLKVLVFAALTLPLAGVVGGFYVELFPAYYQWQDRISFVSGAGMMLLLIVGLLVLENLYRNAGDDQRWGTRYLCIGICLFFVYDFFFYAESLLFKRLDGDLANARPFIAGLAAPFIALSLARVRYWAVDVHVSRQMVFHSAALVGAGLYLIVMSMVGFWIRRYGGEAGSVFQITFLALAGLFLLTMLGSGSLRSRMRLFIARHFYSSKYDYREEWLRFITTLGTGLETRSGPQGGLAEEQSSIAQRIVWAVAPIVDSTAAALWVRDNDSEAFQPTVSWNYGEHLEPLDGGAALVRGLGTSGAVMVCKDGNVTGKGEALIPEWITSVRQTWAIVPLVTRGRLNGILLLGMPRAPRVLDLEDCNLLSTVASQAASYLTEDRATRALAQARKMEEFSQRFTFVAHDLKNVINQLSILVANAERHADNPEFQKDMVATVANSVGRMNTMMADLDQRSQAPTRAHGSGDKVETLTIPRFDLVAALEDFAADWQAQGAHVQFEHDSAAVATLDIVAKRDVLLSTLGHMVQNAIDASGPVALVRVLLGKGKDSFTVDVIDTGPGMDADFINEVFFKPFGTTKEGGYGIGGFQIRQYIRDLGARLDIVSAPGKGTTLKITFALDKFEVKNEAGKLDVDAEPRAQGLKERPYSTRDQGVS